MKSNRPGMRPVLAGVALCLTIGGSQVPADDARGGEVGFLTGVVQTDDSLTGDDKDVEPFIGFRGGSVFSRHWGWYVDAWYTKFDTEQRAANGGRLGEATTVMGRTGFEYLFTPERDLRWFVTAGGAWVKIDFENGGPEDFHRPAASVGIGQRWKFAGNSRFRWEARVDHTLDDNGIGEEDLTQALLVAGITFGPSGGVARGPGGVKRVAPGDSDGDGKKNSRDACPDTPRGSLVDDRGCPVDGDSDGVPDGIDRCPYTRRNHAVGADGCPADTDADGIPDPSDACPATPPGSMVDDWGCPRDGDRDGIPDGLDHCPYTSGGVVVDARGCATDSDGDGVPDGVDRCPDTPAGTAINLVGCSSSPRDEDGDGVPDALDRCPATPSGADVDRGGCAIQARDTDRDGVPDTADRCPGTARGVDVDAAGCETEPPSILGERDRPIAVPEVFFATGSARLSQDSRSMLDRVAEALLAAPRDLRVEIGGHTDDQGDATDNLDLSQRRAEAVREYLISAGVPADRLVARGYGESRPIADNETARGRAKNRRIEVRQIQPRP